jgi:hypothetical protein
MLNLMKIRSAVGIVSDEAKSLANEWRFDYHQGQELTSAHRPVGSVAHSAFCPVGTGISICFLHMPADEVRSEFNRRLAVLQKRLKLQCACAGDVRADRQRLFYAVLLGIIYTGRTPHVHSALIEYMNILKRTYRPSGTLGWNTLVGAPKLLTGLATEF